MKEVVMVFKNHMIGDCFHLWNSEMYRNRDIRQQALDTWMALSGWDVQRVFFAWQMAAARERGKGDAQLAIVQNVLRRRQRRTQAIVLDAFAANAASASGDAEQQAPSELVGVDDTALREVKRTIAEVRALRRSGLLGKAVVPFTLPGGARGPFPYPILPCQDAVFSPKSPPSAHRRWLCALRRGLYRIGKWPIKRHLRTIRH
jgi:hypothetical protein